MLTRISFAMATLAAVVILLISRGCTNNNQSVTQGQFTPAKIDSLGGNWKIAPGYLAVATTGFKQTGSGDTQSFSLNTSLEAVATDQTFILPDEFEFTLSNCGSNKTVSVSLGESAPLQIVEDPSACKVISVKADGWTVDKDPNADGVWNIKQ